MMHRSRANHGLLKWPLIVAGALAFLLVIGWYLPGGVVLAVTPVKGGDPLVVLYLQPGETFTICYYHSVENTPIWETHSVDSRGRIYIEEERYLKFGAGMGKMPGVGHMVQQGPYEAIKGMHMATGNFVLRIGSPGVDHTLIWKGGRLNLSKIAPHAAVQFKARPISRLHRIWDQLMGSSLQTD
jgi:hypothetical protein